MKGILLFIVFAFIIATTTTNIQATELDYDNYDSIYKEDGIWYGIIDITSIYLTGWNCAYGRCNNNALYIAFSRDTENLTSITYDYTTQSRCIGVNLYFVCLGTTIESESGSETVYNESDYGPFLTFLFNANNITKLTSSSKYDYRIVSETTETFDTVEVIRFTYILTNDEVDNVNALAQAQYDQKLHAILIDQTMTFEEKENAASQLKAKYDSFVIEYGEELESLCESEELCHVQSDYRPGEPPPIVSNFLDTIKDNLALMVFGLFALMLGVTFFTTLLKTIATDIVTLMLSAIAHIAQGLAITFYEFIWLPMIRGIRFITTLTFKRIFWWL